ncbi:MAG: hypothetical protein H7X71_05420 [Chitinophagales bacterium]|nr:hypothetical protein [Chitinophagales bacterium]
MNIPFIEGYTQILLDSGIYMDLMSSLQQFDKDFFNTAYSNASVYFLSDTIAIKILSYENLLYEKKKSGREKDKLDAKELENLNK